MKPAAYHQKKTPRVLRPERFLQANPFGSAHRHEGEKLLKDHHGSVDVNIKANSYE